ncbi:MAG: hypothetical protein K6G24_05770 [Lachnospiraceae bacterium]|nr:hypothetical protein [Lachnospiraceae bacterium]
MEKAVTANEKTPGTKTLSRKTTIIIEMAVLAVIILVFVLVNIYISDKRKIVTTNVMDYKYMIDSVTVQEDKLHIEGWAYKSGEEVPELGTEESLSFKIYLIKKDTEITSWEELDSLASPMDTVRVERPDVQNVYGPQEANRNVLNCGFVADIAYDARYLDDYQIAFKYSNDGSKVVNTGVFVKDRISG